MTESLRQYRLDRVQAELKARDIAACVLLDSLNIRYATGSMNSQVMQNHLPARYAFVPAEGKAILFELGNWSSDSEPSETVEFWARAGSLANFGR